MREFLQISGSLTGTLPHQNNKTSISLKYLLPLCIQLINRLATRERLGSPSSPIGATQYDFRHVVSVSGILS